jgi:hypothetical protein
MLTTNDLQTSLAYRLSETSAPSDSTTLAQRLEWMNQGYLAIARLRNWWWLEGTDIANTNTASTTGYAEPTDLKEFIELKIGSTYYDQIPYRNNRDGTFNTVHLPQVRLTREYYRYGGRYYLSPEDDGDATVHTIKYYKRVSKSTSGGTFLIPDEYLEALVAYGEARYWLSISQQAKAQVPYQEYEGVIKDMLSEQGRRGSGSKYTTSIREPEDAYY